MGKFADTSIYGSLDVEGVLNVADKLEGNTGKFSGNVTAPNFIGTASKVANSFKIQLNSGGSEGTNQFTFDGENTKTVNITPGAIGAPTLAGTGASGTWSINISGKSANSDKLGEIPLDRFVYGSTSKGTINEVDSNTIDKSGFYRLKPTASSTNVLPASVHSAVIHIANPSANYGHQLALPYSNNNLYIRRKAEGVWGNFIEILSASNYNNFAPTKTGTGASGTWSIAITGNSASATKLATARTLTIGNTGKTFDGTGNVTWTLADIGASSASHSHNFLNIDNTSSTGASGSVRSGKLQFLQKSGDTAINPDSGWWSVLRTQHAGYDNGYWQEMAYAFASNSIKFRRNVNGTKSSWIDILHSDNYNTYAPSKTGTGASGTWAIAITGNAATVSNGVYTNNNQTITGVKSFSVAQAFNAAQGTAPFSVASNTRVANLNADLLDGLHSSEFRQRASYTLGGTAAKRWVRIANLNFRDTIQGYAIISVSNSYNNNPAGSITFILNYGGYRGTTGQGITITQFGNYASLYTKARIVYPTGTYETGFFEVEYNTTSVGNSIYITSTTSYGCDLLSAYTAGSIPSTHRAYEVNLCGEGFSSKYIYEGSTRVYSANNTNIGTGATNYAAGNQPITAISTTASAATFTRGAGNLTLTYPTFNQSTTGSAASLTTSRTIWGQSFNGTGNVSGALTGVSTITASGTIKSTASQGLNIEVGSGWAYHQLKSGSSIAHLAFNNTAVDGHLANTYHIRPNGSTSVLGINTTHVKALALIVANEGLQINSSNGGSWITGKTSTKGITFPTQTTGNYHTALRTNSASGHVLTYGGINNSIGFYGYLSSLTTNGTSYSFACDTATGHWTASHNITAAKFVKSGSSSAYVLTGDGGHMEHTAANKASTVVDRDSSGDINCRLVRTSYDNQTTISGGIVYRVSTTDNYHRVCSSPAAIRTWLGVQDSNHTHSYLPLAGGNVTGRLVIGTNVANSYGLLTINPTKGNATTGINIWNGSDTTSRIWLSAENALCITRGDNSLTGIAVFATGHVSIGKTTNTERLEVGGNIKGESGFFDTMRIGSKTFYNVATSVSNPSTVTGIIKITMPYSWTNSMGTYEIDIYEYNGRAHSKILISGYNFSGSSWVNTKTVVIGDLPATVRLGHDGSKCCILIGATNTAWTYPQVFVSKVTIGHSQSADISKNWSISYITAETGLSAIMTPPLSKMLSSSNYNDYAPTKTGTGASGTWSISITGNAGTATRLATPRAINGTNFDGTAAITTANWGTARTLTIGNTGKSVNGSGNVAWSLSEIGALPASGGTTSGALSGLTLGVNNSDSTTGRGVSLYAGASTGAPTYGIMFAGTATFGKHGSVQGDWATYLTMSDTTNRGWIFRRGSTNVVSISATGIISGASFNSITGLGGNGSATTVSRSDHSHSYLPLSGGTLSGKLFIKSSGDNAYGGGIEVRERDFVVANQSDWSYSPAISFHWGGRHVKRFGLRSDGKFAVDNTIVSLDGHTHTFSSLTSHIVAGNEFNFVPAGYNNAVHFNYKANGQTTCTVSGYHFRNGNAGFASITAAGFAKNGSTSAYVLLGDGGHKAVSDFATSGHTHSSIIHTNEHTASITLVDHSSYTWLRNAAGSWVFQTGTSGDDWTQSFSFHSPSVTSAGENSTWFEIGQRQSNTAAGKYRGVRIRKYSGSTCVDGDLYTANIYATSSGDLAKLSFDSEGKLRANNSGYRRAGMYGVYDSTKTGHIWSMGTAYMIPNDGTNFGNLYGLAYKHTNNTTGGSMAGGHQMVWCENGSPKAAMGSSGVWAAGGFLKSGSDNNYMLLGGGGHKAVSDFWLKTALNTTSIDFSCRNLTVAGSISQTSSIKYKTDVTKFEKRALELIKEVNVVNYRYKTSLEQTHIGFIAENTPKELSTQDQNIMDIGSCIGVLIKAVQELENEIKNLKNGK